MTRPAKRPSPRRRTPRRQPATAPQEAGTGHPLADARIRPLLERYCELAGVKHVALHPDHTELRLPKAERPFFGDRETLRLAFSLEALERDPDAQIAVLGSPFLSQLLAAIRARAARLSLGLIALPARGGPQRIGLSIPVRDGAARPGKRRVAVHPVGRLVARVVLRAGAGVEEGVVESDVYDLSTGARVADDLASLFQDLEAGRIEPADPSLVGAAPPVPAREPEDLLRLLLGHLRDKSQERVAARRAAAEQELAVELGRLDRYFGSILNGQSDPDGVAQVTALAARRRAEEVRRSQVRAIVHPLQLVEAVVLMERAEWRLESARGHRATFTTQRHLSGGSAGSIACPHCGRPPATLVVCRHDHCGCDVCSHRCTVCGEDFCSEHGIAECRVDGQPACDEHTRACPSCRLQYCTAHEGVCAEDGHSACSACLEACGSCGRVVCNRHAERSHPDAPKGRRRLCGACLRYCEGGSREPVGVDEVTACASCGKVVCTAHSAVCAVDGQAHCSPHLLRTDQSQRVICGRHRASCTEEAAAIFASDEVGACGSCGKLVCADHSAECVADGLRHCLIHLQPLVDTNDSYACPDHRKTCHVEGRAFSPRGVAECPVCGQDACARHRAACGSCGRQVCTTDLDRESSHCATCRQLAVIADPPEDVVAAARAVTGGRPQPVRVWRIARDHRHLVVELDLGRSRKAVFTLRHGDTVPEGIVRQGLPGSPQQP